jgi:hypothetical protein
MPMKKTPRPYYERFRKDVIGVYIGALVMVLGYLVFSQYTQGWQWSLQSPSIWLIIGWSILAGGSLVWGMIAGFRQRTRKIAAGNHIFELSHPKPIKVTTHHYQVNKEVLQQVLPATYQGDIEAASRVTPGTDGRGFSVPLEVLEPGGVDAHGFHSLEGGSQGYIITRGKTQVIHMGVIDVIPHTLELVDHTKVPTEVITHLKQTRTNFRENISPIYEIGPLDGGVEDWLASSPAAQSAVLRNIQFDGLATLFMDRLETLLFSSKNSSKLKEAWKLDPKNAIRLAFNEWLKAQPQLLVAMGNGEAGADYWRSYALSLLSELNRTNASLETKQETLWERDQHELGQAKKRNRSFGAPPTQAPNYSLADRPPSEYNV